MKRQEQITEILNKDMGDPWSMDRRDFMKRLGGGLIISFSLSGGTLVGCKPGEAPAGEREGVNAYLQITEDGRVTLYTGKIEMGQGPITSLPMMLADELDVSLETVDIIMGDTDLCPYDRGTYGSLSTRRFGQTMRGAAAKARLILLDMAAEALAVPAERLTVSEGVVSDSQDPSNSISYADLTSGQQILEDVDEEAELKQAGDFKIMGQSRLSVDSEDKVTGRARYSADIQLPGMMYARILRPPSLGARLQNVDTSAAEAIEGVEIVRDGDMVAVLHASQETAANALLQIKADWEEEENPVDDENLFDYLVKEATEANELEAGGDLNEGMRGAKLIESEFHDPYIAHAPLENHTATAHFEKDRLVMWASCQTPYPTKEDIAEELGIAEDRVHLKQIFLGGGFGGKIYNPQAIEAARLAQLSGKPIQLVYTRQEEFMFDRLRPAAVIKVKSAVRNGRISAWDLDLYTGGKRELKLFYDIPNHRTVHHESPRGRDVHPFHTGAWRGPSVNTNTFAKESQIDILAAAAGVDPVEFRLRHLDENPRMAGVLRRAAGEFGWEAAKGPSGRGYGISCAIDVGTHVAMISEVEVNEGTGEVQVKRVVCAQDMGLIVNRHGARIQTEGGILMGLGYALSEEIRFRGRRMISSNFNNYLLPRISQTPEIEVVFIDAQDQPPHGGGEPGVVGIGACLANAIFDATGARMYRQPMTPARVLEAIKAI